MAQRKSDSDGSQKKGRSRKSATQRGVEARYLAYAKISGHIASVLITLFKYGFLAAGIVATAFYSHKCVECLAGLETNADISISFFSKTTLKAMLAGDSGLRNTIFFTFGVFGTIYGIAQKWFRRKDIARLKTRDPARERRIDPRRSSSLLTERGETRPEDKNAHL